MLVKRTRESPTGLGRAVQKPASLLERTGFELPRPVAVPQANFDYCGGFLASAQASTMIAELECTAFKALRACCSAAKSTGLGGSKSWPQRPGNRSPSHA
jgi:hypothetical protein